LDPWGERAFQFASTNLVLDLGIILTVLIGWEFVAAEFAGGLIMVALLTVLLRAAMTPQRIMEAKRLGGSRAGGLGLAAEILGQLGCGALHRVSVGLGVVMAAAVDETVLRIWIGN